MNGIVYASMGFSILSLAITGLAMLSQRKIIQSRDFVSIEFDITGPSIMANKKSCKNRVKSIQNAIASLVGLDEELIEIIRPTTIKQGLKLSINMYINNTKAIDMNIEKDINEANETGNLQGIIKDAWNLSSDPMITNIKYEKHASKERQDRTVSLGVVKTNSDHQIATAIKVSSISDIEQDNQDNLFSKGNHEADMLMMDSPSSNANVELPPMIPPVVQTQGGLNDDGESQSSNEEDSIKMKTTGINSGEDSDAGSQHKSTPYIE